MSHTNSLVDLGDGPAVSNNSPQSPTIGALLENPITLDFDPMSFQCKEESPLTSPTDNHRELRDAFSSQNIEFFDPFCPVKEESPTDYYPNVMIEQSEPLNDHSPELPQGYSFTNYEVFRSPVESTPFEAVYQEGQSVTANNIELQDAMSEELQEAEEQRKLHETVEQLDSPEYTEQMTLQNAVEQVESPEVIDLLGGFEQMELPNAKNQLEVTEQMEFPDVVESPEGMEQMELPNAAEQTESHEVIDLLGGSLSPAEPLSPERSKYDYSDVKPEIREQVVVAEEVTDYSEIENAVKEDEVFQHGECLASELDYSRRTKTTSMSSISSKSERSEKKTRNTSLTSSESSVREEEKDRISMIKSTKKDERIIQNKELPEIKTSEKLSSKSEKNYKAVNGIDKTVGMKNGIGGGHIENSLNGKADSPECPVSVTELRSTFVHQTAQGNLSVSPSKEVIETGIDLKSLKSSYTQHAVEGRDNISPLRETISTGVDIKALKSSFNKSDDESHRNSFQEEVKPSVDRAKVQRTFSQSTQDDACLCKICGKHVYQMEKMKAEKCIFHKNCFRCKECNKLLNVDSYSSNEGDLYCKPHFKQLFQPKARFDGDDTAPTALHTDELDSDEGRQRRNELIIRENTPAELPPDVVRSDSRPDHGLESLPVNLNNLKSKFEQYREEHHLPSTADACTLQRSASVMARLAKYQSAVSGENNENGDVSESESEGESEDPSIIKPTKHKEKVVFSGMSSLKSQWETGSVTVTKEERNEEKKEELNKLRQRMCLGRSESMKAVYEKACQDSAKSTTTARTEPVDLGRDIKATRIKEKFEKGDVSEVDEEKLEKARKEKEEELSVFTEPVMATDAKKLFKQIDATVKTTAISPSKSPSSEHKESYQNALNSQLHDIEVVKCSEPTAKEEIRVDTTDLSQRFKFFENYSECPKEKRKFEMTPPREPAKESSPEPGETSMDPNIVRAIDSYDDIPQTDTTRRMLDKFKALEKESPAVPSGPKPLKRITPPREYTKEENHDSSPEPERDPNIVRASYKTEDDIVVEADKAKSLKAMFENWDTELRENRKSDEELEEDYLPQVDTTKTLRAKFEAIKDDTQKPTEKPKGKINRFVQEYCGPATELCSICEKKVYPMEKMETSGMRLHKNCFRCAHCGCMLRLENYTTSGGRLYCTPHFKQLFISRGNYDEGFGREQHKEKWNRSCNNTPTPRDLHENCDVVDYTNGDVQCLEQTV